MNIYPCTIQQVAIVHSHTKSKLKMRPFTKLERKSTLSFMNQIRCNTLYTSHECGFASTVHCQQGFSKYGRYTYNPHINIAQHRISKPPSINFSTAIRMLLVYIIYPFISTQIVNIPMI